MDKALSAIEKYSYDVIQKWKQVTKKYIDIIKVCEHFQFLNCVISIFLKMFYTFFPFLNDVIRNLFHDILGFDVKSI